MNDRRGDDPTDRDPQQRDHQDGRGHRDRGPDADRDPRGRQGEDTRFLQLEMSQVLYAEAEGVTKQAFRELLLEAAKAHLRDRFGETITRLAQLATGELLSDIEASLDVEEQIQRRRESQGSPTDRLREALARKPSDRGQPSAERKGGSAPSSRKRRR
jgi:hypothetical protein